MMDWKPIETAPKDGTWFVIWIRDHPEVGRFNPLITKRYEPAGDGLFKQVEVALYEWDGFNNFCRATHWAALFPPEDPEK